MALAAFLAACQPTGMPGALSGVGVEEAHSLSAIRIADSAIDETLVRAPELFRAAGTAEWNGLRTARGVWAAHPKALSPRRVRIVNRRNGAEIDGMLYRSSRAEGGDIVTLSSDAARALGMEKDAATPVSLFGLRPQGTQTRAERARVETRAQGELATLIARMDDIALLRLVAAAMRAMGYATVFEPGPGPQAHPTVRAFAAPNEGLAMPSIRVVVRPRMSPQAGAGDVGAVQTWLTGSGDLGVLVSVPGFEQGAVSGLSEQGARLELVDLDALLNIWLTHYEQMSPPDQALLPLRPIYFLASD